MIIRIRRHGRPFTVVDNALLEDGRLSFKAKGLLAYLLSRPQGWRACRKHLAKVGTDRATAVASAIAELRRLGYVELRRLRGDDGTLAGTEVCVHERPPREGGKTALGESSAEHRKPSVGRDGGF